MDWENRLLFHRNPSFMLYFADSAVQVSCIITLLIAHPILDSVVAYKQRKKRIVKQLDSRGCWTIWCDFAGVIIFTFGHHILKANEYLMSICLPFFLKGCSASHDYTHKHWHFLNYIFRSSINHKKFLQANIIYMGTVTIYNVLIYSHWCNLWSYVTEVQH